MKLLVSIFLIIFSFQEFAQAGQSGRIKDFVALSPERELFVDYVPAKGKQPTVILINGLTYSTVQWNRFVAPLIARGVGVLRYDPVGQGQTLLRYAPILNVIPSTDQVADLKLLLEVLEIPAPYNLAGLSYGGGIALGFAAEFPELVQNLILMAPYTRPVQETDDWIKAQIWVTRKMFPYNPYSDDDLYDHFLHQIVYATYPQAEPIVLENPFKLEATFRLVQGIRSARPMDTASTLPEASVHLMIARSDQYIKTSVLDEYWDVVPLASRASRIYINDSEHKMVEAVPVFTASWVYEILKGNKRLFQGKDFEGYPLTGEVKASDEKLKVGKE